nr:hypothetical protein [Tanacetum cinerariifolium]
KKEVIHLLLTRTGDEIYSSVDACKIAHEMWIAVERIQHVATMQVNVQFLQQLQPEWSSCSTISSSLLSNTKSHRSLAPPSKQSSSTVSNANTKYKGKEIAKPITPPSEPASEEDKIDEQELEARFNYMAKIQEVPTADSRTDTEPLEQVQYDAKHNVFANERHQSEQSESISNTCVVEKVDSNVIPDSPGMCNNDIQTDQIAVECDDERVALANLIENLKLDVDENKKIQKQLKKANTSLAHDLTECKSILAKTSRTLRESNSIRDSCLISLQNKQTELEKYKTLNDRTVDYDKLKRKLNETLGLLAQKEIDI